MGALLGTIFQGYLSSLMGLKKTIAILLAPSVILMVTFQWLNGTDWIFLLFDLYGFRIQGGFLGLYAVAARMYPAEFRTTGLGWANGMGRFGGIIGLAAVGVLISLGYMINITFVIFAVPIFLAGVITYCLSSKSIS